MSRQPAIPALVRVDLLAFTLGLTAYAELVGSGSEGASAEVLKSGSAHCLRADVVSTLTSFLEAVDQVFRNSTTPPAMLTARLERASAMRGAKKFLFVGETLPLLFNWFQSRRSEFEDVLSGPARTSIPALQKLGDTTGALQRLRMLGEFEYRSTIRVFRRWILEEALPTLGAAPTGVAALAADMASTKPYLEELRGVEQELATTDPGSEAAAELVEQKTKILGQLDDMVEESANPQALETAVGSALAQTESPLAALGRKYGLNEEQAGVVATMGNAIVSAGAGSGKTTTLIAVVRDSLERGYKPDQILGTTFTNKASEEFNERMNAKGIEGVRFGTTHSIAGDIIRRGAPHLSGMLDRPERADRLFEMAIEQVQMRPRGATAPPDLSEKPIVPETTDPPPGEAPAPEEGVPPSAGVPGGVSQVGDQLIRVREALRKHPWATILEEFRIGLERPGARPLSPRQLEVLQKMEARPAGGFTRRRAGEVEELEIPMPKQAGAPGEDEDVKTRFWKEPVNQWFNLDMAIQSKPRELRTLVGQWQNNALSWQKAWSQYGFLPPPRNTEDEPAGKHYEAAAVYAAYVWLKKNDPQYGPVLDFDDWLGKAVEVLKQKPQFLSMLQQRYKVVIVDEAQDNNGLQWELFGMLAAKSDRYMLVGDDFQSIYRFRGADTSQFIQKPEQGFKLLQMETNYRSGSNIVETANVLIARNKKQIKKVCRAARQNGEGLIEAKIVPTHNDVALQTAESIASQIEAGAKASDFGVAVRNSAEMDAFCLALMAKQIPFLCNRDPLGGMIPKAALAWMTLALGKKMPRGQVNDAIAVAHQIPGFFLDKVFVQNLRAKVPKDSDQLQTLLDGVEIYTGSQSRRNQNVEAYAEAIRDIQQYSGSSKDLLRAVLDIRGQKGTTFLDKLKANVDPEDIPPGLQGEEREEAIKSAAKIPLDPLFGVAEAVPNPLEFMAYVDKLQRAKELAKKGRGDNEPAVRIGTTHGWKGLEAKHMTVVMADGVFPSPYAYEEEEGEEEERRLAYVAITRGKESVEVYSPLISYRGPKRPLRPGIPPPPPRASVFVEEMVTSGCMPMHGQELLFKEGGGFRDPELNAKFPSNLSPEELEAEAEIQELEEANAAGDEFSGKFARRLLASMDPPQEEGGTLELAHPLWKDLA